MVRKVLALIPARGGSKGVPGKNKRLVAGKPLIRYSIDAAQASDRVTNAVVTTDDPDILAIARASGVLTIERPVEIAQDTSPVIDAVRHALAQMEVVHGLKFDAIALLQPTAPLRTGADVDRAVDLFFAGNGNPVCSVTRCEDNHPARMYTVEGNRLKPLMPELASMRRQDLPSVYHRNGALYVFGDAQVNSGQIIAPLMTPYEMTQSESINIDTEFDLLVLEALLARR